MVKQRSSSSSGNSDPKSTNGKGASHDNEQKVQSRSLLQDQIQNENSQNPNLKPPNKIKENSQQNSKIGLIQGKNPDILYQPNGYHAPFQQEQTENSAAFGFHLIPRFNEIQLNKRLHDKLVQQRKKPIQYYELKLFNACKQYHLKCQGYPLSFRALKEFYHLLKLQEIQSGGNFVNHKQIQHILSHKKDNYQTGKYYQQYKIFNKLTSLCNGLMAKWKIPSQLAYFYRYTGRTLNVRMLDLEDMNSNIMTMGTFWVLSIINRSPFNQIANEALKQCTKVLRIQVLYTYNLILNMVQAEFNIEGDLECALTSKSRSFRKFMGLKKSDVSETVRYQKLSLPGIFTRFCCPNEQEKKTLKLKKELVNLEAVYRDFEKYLIESLLETQKPENIS